MNVIIHRIENTDCSLDKYLSLRRTAQYLGTKKTSWGSKFGPLYPTDHQLSCSPSDKKSSKSSVYTNQ